jgi:hypothetical protein
LANHIPDTQEREIPVQLKNRHCFRWCRINGVFLVVVALSCTAFPTVPGRTEELGHDYNYGLGKIDLRSQSPAQNLRFTLPLLIPGDIKAWLGIPYRQHVVKCLGQRIGIPS